MSRVYDEDSNTDLPGPLTVPDLSSGWYSKGELEYLGFSGVGRNVKVSRKCSLYAIRGYLGDNVRIDDFVTLKGHLEIGSFVHICAYSLLSGVGGRIKMDDFSVLAARCSVYTASNDHGADVLPAPLAPKEYTKQHFGPISIGLGVQVGAHCVLLPGTTICDGASIGAGCIVRGEVGEGVQVRQGRAITKLRNVAWIKTLALRVLENFDGEV